MYVTFAGISMEVIPVPRKASSSMVRGSLDPEINSTAVRLSFQENALLKMLLTLAGIVTDVRPLAPLNANCAIDSTPSGITALPVQLACPVTAFCEIVNVPEPVTDPSVTQGMSPSATAFAGFSTKPDIVKAKVVIIVAKRRIRFLLPAS